MSTGMLITVYLSSAFIAAIIASIAAPVKSRHVGYWMIFAFLMPPIVLILLLLPRGRRPHHYGRDPFHDHDDNDTLL